MNSSERVLAAIQGVKTDRRAVILVLSLYGAGLIKCPLPEYYTNANAYIDGQLTAREKFGHDVVFSPFALPLLGKAFGSEVRYFNDQPPNMIAPAYNDPAAFLQTPLPDIDSEPALLYLRETLQGLVTASKQQYPVAAISLSAVDIPIMIFGINTWLEIMLFDQKNAMLILEKCSDFFIKWTNTLFNDGAAFVALPLTFANLRIITPKLLKEIALPALNNTFARCKGPLIVHHAGGFFQDMLPCLRDLPNVIGFCLGKQDNLTDARNIVKPDALILGNIDGPDLLGKDAGQIHQQVTMLLEQQQNDNHFVLSTSAPDIDLFVPQENILAIIQAANDFHKGFHNASVCR